MIEVHWVAVVLLLLLTVVLLVRDVRRRQERPWHRYRCGCAVLSPRVRRCDAHERDEWTLDHRLG